ncbi:MAG: CoA ester lyase [Burkholderiales bacterium PBB6]|nr:MAG: CoA ester lyase [Burkholderiales bacterium PBB6]
MDPALARSMLFVPGDRPERFGKAVASGADAVILDLEDAVAPASKCRARDAIADFLQRGGQAMLRINGLDHKSINDDLALCGLPGVTGIVYPKAESSTQLQWVRSRMRSGVALMPLIETAVGLRDVHQVAATPGVTRLLFGHLDFCLDLGLEPGDDEAELAAYRSTLVLASRACGLHPPVDGVTVNVHDSEELSRAALAARRCGFGGKLCIHPAQVSKVNAAFSASSNDLAWARRVMDAAEGQPGAFLLDGQMVDAPVLGKAQRLLAGVAR